MTVWKMMLVTKIFVFIYDLRSTWQAKHDLFTLLTVKVPVLHSGWLPAHLYHP